MVNQGTGNTTITLGPQNFSGRGNWTLNKSVTFVTGAGGGGSYINYDQGKITGNTGGGTVTFSAGTLGIYIGRPGGPSDLVAPIAMTTGTMASMGVDSFGVGNPLTMSGTAAWSLQNNNHTLSTLTGVSGNSISLGSATLTLSNGSDATFAGIISGTGSIVKTGTATETFSGANTYTGGTSVNVGTLNISGSASSTASGIGAPTNANPVTVATGATLTFSDAAIGAYFANSFSGGGTVNQNNGSGIGVRLAGNWTGFTGTYVQQPSTRFLMWDSGFTGGSTSKWQLNASTGGGGIFSAVEYGTNVAWTPGFNSGTTNTINLGELSGTSTATNLGNFTNQTNQTGTTTFSVGALNTNSSFAGIITNTVPGSSAFTSSTVNLTKIGTGRLTLSATNTYIGTTTVSAGTLQAGSSNSVFGTNSAVSLANVASAILDLNNFNVSIGSLAGGGNIGGNVTLGTGVLTVGGANTNTTYSGTISGMAGSLVKTGTGTLSLNNTNSYTGGTTLQSGTLAEDSAQPYGTGSITVTGNSTIASMAGAIQATVSNNILINAGNTLSLNSSNFGQTFTGVISGAGNLSTASSGTTTLTATNTYTGTTSIPSGTLQLSGGGSLGSGSYAAAIASTGTFQFSSSADQTFSGTFSGTGALIKDTSSASTLTLSGTTSYTGNTTVSAGKIAFRNSYSSGNLTITNPGIIELFVNAGILDFASSTISGTGTLIKTGAGTARWGVQVLTMSLGNGSLIDIKAGTLDAGSSANDIWTANKSSLNVAAGATLTEISYGAAVFDALTGSGNISMDGTNNFTVGINNQLAGPYNSTGTSSYSGILSQTGNFIKSGTGTQVLSGTNTYTGTTTINGGTLIIGGTGSLGSGNYAGAIANAGTLTYSSSANQTFSAAFSGAGSLIKDTNNSTLTFSGTTSYSGTTTLSAGTISLSGVGNGFVSSTSIATGTTLNLNSTNTTVDTMTLGLNNAGTQFSGTGTITKTGTGWVQGDNNVFVNFNGTINIQAGTLGSGMARGDFGNATSPMVVDISAGAKFDLRGSGANSAQINQLTGSGSVVDTWNGAGAAGDTLTIGTNNGSSTFDGLIKGAGGGTNNTSDDAGIINLIKAGTGNLTLTGANTYKGSTTINGGTLKLKGSSPRIASTTFNNATMEFQQTTSGFGNRSSLSWSVSGAGTYNFNSNANAAGTSNGGWVAFGCTAPANYFTGTGPVNVNSGVLARDCTNVDTFNSSSDYTIAANAVFAAGRGGNSIIGGLNGAGDVCACWSGGSTGSITIGNGNKDGNFSGILHGNGNATDGDINGGILNVVKTGTGIQLLSGVNTYTGSTTVSGGSLVLGDGIATGNIIPATNLITNNSALTYNTPSNITHSGVISGTGTFTKQGTGTLTLTGNNTYTGNTTISGGTLYMSGTGKIYSNLGWAARTITINTGTTAQIDRWYLDNGFGQVLYTAGNLVLNNGTIRYMGSGDTVCASATDPNCGRAFTIGATGATLDSATAGQTWEITKYNAGEGYPLSSNGGALTLTGSGNGIIDKVIPGAGAIIKSGTGTWRLNGANTYTGGTTINGGTMVCGSVSAFGNGTVTVNAGGTLNINGCGMTNLVVNNGGVVIP